MYSDNVKIFETVRLDPYSNCLVKSNKIIFFKSSMVWRKSNLGETIVVLDGDGQVLTNRGIPPYPSHGKIL